MTTGIDPSTAQEMSDEEIGKHLSQNFRKSIQTMAQANPKHFDINAPFSKLLLTSTVNDMRVLPICDKEERVVGIVGQNDLLSGLGNVLEMEPEEEIIEESKR